MDELTFELLSALREREHLTGTEDWRVLDVQQLVDHYIAQARAEERERCTRIVNGFKRWAKEGGVTMTLLNQVEQAIREADKEE